MVIRSRFLFVTLGCVFAALTPQAEAQTWPTRTITLVVPFAAGSGTDSITRVLAEKLSARLGQPVVVENKAGAASAIGTTYVAKAAPDGYTLLMTTNSAQVILPLTQNAASLNYDPARDFTAIGLTAVLPNILIVSPKVPATNLDEFIRYAKHHQGGLSFDLLAGLHLPGYSSVAKSVSTRTASATSHSNSRGSIIDEHVWRPC